MERSLILMLPYSLVPAFTLLLQIITVFVAIWKYTVDIQENTFCVFYKESQSSTIPFYIRTGSVVAIAVLKPKFQWQLGKYNSFSEQLVLILLMALTAGGDQVRKETKKNTGPLNKFVQTAGNSRSQSGLQLMVQHLL